MGLRAQQRAFLEAYLQCWNASEAARRAGYSEKTAGSQGHDLLKNPEIQAAIEARLAELRMGADEVLVRLAEQARSDMADFISIRAGLPFVDLEKAERAGKLRLLKKFRITGKGVEIELYDAQTALVQLGKATGALKDDSAKVDVYVDLSDAKNRLAQLIGEGADAGNAAEVAGGAE